VKAGKHRKYFARKNQNNNNNFITKSIVNMGGSISAGTVAQFVRNKQRSVAFVEDDHYMTIKNCMPFIAFDKSFEFLNGGNINLKD